MKTKSSYSVWTRKLFDRYLAWNFKRNFQHIYCKGLENLNSVKGPLLFVANHVSWWDGFFLFEVQRRIRPTAKLYTVALKKTYLENPILQRMGVLPLQPGNPGSLKALLKQLRSLRETIPAEDLMVTFFPQGKITPSFSPDLNFQRGIETVLSSLLPIQVIPVGIHIEPMTGKVPSAILSLGQALSCESSSFEKEVIETQVQKVLGEIHSSLNSNGESLPPEFEKWRL
jgi:1-acyl-sn-glycerol-3-phosphate acyltransferase